MRKIFVETSIPFSRRRTIISSVPFSFIAASISEVNAASVMIMSTSSNLQIFTRLPFPNLLKAIRLLGDEKTQGRMAEDAQWIKIWYMVPEKEQSEND